MPRAKAPASRDERRALFRRMIDDLKKERDDITKRLAAIDQELAEYGVAATATARSAGGRRAQARAKPRAPRASKKAGAPRKGSLKEYIMKVAGAEPKSTGDIAKAAVKAGYKTKSKTLAQSVSVACSQLATAGQLKKKGRGLYVSA